MKSNQNKFRTHPRFAERLTSRCALFAALMLGACGGGGGSGDSSMDKTGQVAQEAGASNSGSAMGAQAPKAAPSAQTIALQEEGARLNTAELEQIAKTGVMPIPFDGPLLSGAEGSTAATLDTEAAAKSLAEQKSEQKSAASRVAAYRFFNSGTGAHFFTTSVAERNSVRDTNPAFTYEGPAFYASATAVPGLSPVHRFYNIQTGVHFYTISEAERANVAATLPQFNYEGIGYYASTLPGTGYTPLYRFFYSSRGFHFYTNSQSERDTIIATLPQYSYEGIGYYVLNTDWQTPAIPHSGITNTQCYRAGQNALVGCASAGADALNTQQDGDRTAINPMSYSDIISGYIGTFPFSIPLYYPRTDCVRDNVTGLIWEGKEASGDRSGRDLFTNYEDDRSNNASTYVRIVNGSGLCGFNDWRLPTVEELHGIVNYGMVGSAAKVTSDWYPNTNVDSYWTATRDAVSSSFGWAVQFAQDAGTVRTFRAEPHAVRLVRGAAWTGPRHIIDSKPYPGDGANNAVIDRKTGLTWRRCLEGERWNGSACSFNNGFHLSHEGALTQGANRGGWRMPNIKELTSLPDQSRTAPALDLNFFPGAVGTDLWSTTPYAGASTGAMRIHQGSGTARFNARENLILLRLVYDEP